MVGLDDFVNSLRETRPDFVDAESDAATKDKVVRDLRDLRIARGMSQRDIAETMGTTQSAVSDIETGVSDVRLSTLQRYARSVDAELQITVSCLPTVRIEWPFQTSAVQMLLAGHWDLDGFNANKEPLRPQWHAATKSSEPI